MTSLAAARRCLGFQLPKTEDQSRSDAAKVFEGSDEEAFRAEVVMSGAKTALEFGPGLSTQALLDAGIQRVVTCENIDKWLAVAKKRFKKDERVTVLKFHDEFPVIVDGLDPNEKFDIGFVDAPKGFYPVRKVHPGYADCSRLNTLLFALNRCKVVFLHDAVRPLERGSLGRIWATGHFDIEFMTGKFGMARITHREQKQDRPDTQDAKESRRPTARAKSKRRRKPVNRRPNRPSVCEPSGEGHNANSDSVVGH